TTVQRTRHDGRVRARRVQLDRVLPERTLDRFVRFRVRTVLGLLAILHVLVWVLISVFLALALDPLVRWLQRRGIRRRAMAATTAFLLVFAAFAAVAAAFVPTLIDQVDTFAHQVPGWIDDLTKGRGRFGFLETRYHIVERVRQAVRAGGV